MSSKHATKSALDSASALTIAPQRELSANTRSASLDMPRRMSIEQNVACDKLCLALPHVRHTVGGTIAHDIGA